MRQVLSWRLLAAVVTLVVLALFVNFAFAGRDSIAEITEPEAPIDRRADIIALVLDTQLAGFSIDAEGRSTGEALLTLAPPYDQTVRLFAGMPGTNTCLKLGEFGQCALLASLHGDTIAAFSLVPTAPGFTFELPAIEELDGGYAQLVDGWQVPYASTIDRSGCDTPAESFSEFLRIVGTNFRSLFSLGANEINAVVC